MSKVGTDINNLSTPFPSQSSGIDSEWWRGSETIINFRTYLEGRKEMFYLTTHSTHFILRLYGVGHMVKDHSDSERGNPLPPAYVFLQSVNGYYFQYMDGEMCFV